MRIMTLATVAALGLTAAACHKPAAQAVDAGAAKSEAAAAAAASQTATTDASAAPAAAPDASAAPAPSSEAAKPSEAPPPGPKQ